MNSIFSRGSINLPDQPGSPSAGIFAHREKEEGRLIFFYKIGDCLFKIIFIRIFPDFIRGKEGFFSEVIIIMGNIFKNSFPY